jgi:predicted ester cyclase
MSKSIARRFIQEIFNEGKIEEAEKFVTPDITYHGVFDQVRGLEDFKRWIVEDQKAFSDMHLIIEDDFAEANKVAIRWTLNLTHGKEFSDIPGLDIFHFEKDKIKEAWTIFDALTPAAQLGIVEKRTREVPPGTRRFRL